MALLRYPLPEPRGILSHHAALRFRFSERTRLIFQRVYLRDTCDRRLTFCAVWRPFVSPMLAFLSAPASLDLPAYGYGGPLLALSIRKVRIDPQGLV